MDSFEETRELLASAHSGAPEALEQLAAKYGAVLRSHVRELMGTALRDEADSQDLVQELFLDLIRGFDSQRFDSERAFLRWARHVARNNVRDLARRRIHRRPPDAPHATGPAERAARSEDQPSRVAARGEDESHLWRELERMPAEERLSIELREQQQLSWEVIAARTGRPSGDAARVFHARTLAKLATRLRELGE